MADIFLSYAREDEPRAKVIAHALEASGWSVWWDRRIPHGKDFSDYIQGQLDGSRCILVLWSRASVASQFVRDEATEGLATEGRDGRLVPVLLEQVKQPIGFRQLQAADLIEWDGQPAHAEFERLVHSIETLAPRRTAASPEHFDRPWYQLPRVHAVPTMRELRTTLEARNLHDTEEPPFQRSSPEIGAEGTGERTADGSYNDLQFPTMGSRGRRFGRNVPLERTRPDVRNLLTPSPRLVSRELMTRHQFQPAWALNLLAAAWGHFVAHGRFLHARSVSPDTVEIPLPADDDWPGGSMRIARSLPDPAPPGSRRPPAFANLNSHWWDASQVYGSHLDAASETVKGQGGRLDIDAHNALTFAVARAGRNLGFQDNYWIGLSAVQAVFLLEHNHICGKLAKAYPRKNERWLFGKAATILAALMAKIHLLEWLTAMTPNPSVGIVIHANWLGELHSESEAYWTEQDADFLGGIVGSVQDHKGVPFALTEELAAVYRMHPLMPDDFTFRSLSMGSVLARETLPAVCGPSVQKLAERVALPDLLYSLGVSHPGVVTLHNYPKHLQNLRTGPSEQIDLATVEIFRDRERGVPRYNEFRKLVGKEPLRSIDELTDDRSWATQLRHVYKDDLSKVDLMAGLFAEPVPSGFSFSETAFRIMLLMHARWLKSDRFFTNDYRPEVYTKVGIEHIQATDLSQVLLRHVPALAPALNGVGNPFNPWRNAEERPTS